MKKIENFIGTIGVLSMLSMFILMVVTLVDHTFLVDLLCSISVFVLLSFLVVFLGCDFDTQEDKNQLKKKKMGSSKFRNFRVIIAIRILNFLILIVNFLCFLLVGIFFLLCRGSFRLLGFYIYLFITLIAGSIDILRIILFFVIRFILNKFTLSSNEFIAVGFISKKVKIIDNFLFQVSLSAVKNFVDKKPLKQF
ncbi:hypothetical protein K8R66_00820 [bacterium]|nr:hypothetical protein [bacterium]